MPNLLAHLGSHVYNSMGVVLWRHGRMTQALEQYARALEIDPWNRMAAENLRTALRAGVERGGGP